MKNHRKICVTAGSVVPAVPVVLAVLLMANICVSFAETADVEKGCSLTVSFAAGDESAAGAGFELYRVTEMTDGGRYELTGDYGKYEKSIEYLDRLTSGGPESEEELSSLALTLSVYTEMDRMEPAAEVNIGEDGKCVFDGLEPGIYLLKGDPVRRNGYMHIPQPYLITIGEDGSDVSVVVKSRSRKTGGTGIALKVLKIWENDGGVKRPDSVSIVLMKDGRIFDRAELTEEGGWSCSWTGLDDSSVWTAAEYEIPSGYKVCAGMNGDSCSVTNRADGNGTEERRIASKLPQTGAVWYAAAAAAAAGILLLKAGKRMKTGHKTCEESQERSCSESGEDRKKY